MRMKDSDDYITARAANPRTGLISPSVGSPSSPRYRPGTPGSPAEALRQAEWRRHEVTEPDSPTMEIRARPALKRNDAQGAAGPAWWVDENGWLVSGGVGVRAEPEVSAVDADAGVCRTRGIGCERREEDVLTVHMPSAREPQPYAYPGYSAQQIEALKMGRKKTCGGQEKMQRLVSSGKHLPNDRHCTTGAEVDALVFAPFSSPRTPASKINPISTAMNTLQRPGTNDENAPGHIIHRKPLLSSTTSPTDGPTSFLPRVRLTHPSLAAKTTRQCSLGCPRDAETDLCVQRRLASSDHSPNRTKNSLFDTHATQRNLDGYTEGLRHESEAVSNAGRGTWCLSPSDIIVGVLITLTNAIKIVPLPKTLPTVLTLPLKTLTAETASPQEKSRALKEILSSVGQALLLITLTAMVWQVGSAVMRCVCVILWPLGVLGRMVRWVVVGS